MRVKHLLIFVLFILGLSACKKKIAKTIYVEGVVWNSALNEPFSDFSMTLLDAENLKVVNTVTTNLTGNFTIDERTLSEKDYILQFELEDDNYPWYALSTEITLPSGTDTVVLFPNYRLAELFVNIDFSLGVYDSISVLETHTELGTTHSTSLFTTSIGSTHQRAEGTWDYEVHYYRDALDSSVLFSMDLKRKSALAYAAGENVLSISF